MRMNASTQKTSRPTKVTGESRMFCRRCGRKAGVGDKDLGSEKGRRKGLLEGVRKSGGEKRRRGRRVAGRGWREGRGAERLLGLVRRGDGPW